MLSTFSIFAFVSLLLFSLGAVIGSFLNVIIYRTAHDEDWIHGRSRCEDCKKKIHWFDNIPVLSFLILEGKCRNCKASISLTHPVVELLTGTLFVWWYWTGTFFFKLSQEPFQLIQPLFWLIIGVLFLVIVITDILYFLIPDRAVLALLGSTIFYRIALLVTGIMQPTDFWWSLVGVVIAVAFFAGLWLITKGKGMGFGDVKLMAPIALLVGWPQVIVTIFLSFLIGACVGVGLILVGKKKFGQHIPFGPFIILATVITLIWGDALVKWYLGLLGA